MSPLDKDQFTEEQWKEIMAEIDRERLRASETARKKARSEFETELEQRIAEALAAEREKLQMSEQERVQAEFEKRMKEIEKERNALAIERKRLTAQKELTKVGLDDATISELMPIFEGLPDKGFDEALGKFVETTTKLIESRVTEMQEKLLREAAPPQQSGSPVVDPQTVIKSGEISELAQAVGLLMSQQP